MLLQNENDQTVNGRSGPLMPCAGMLMPPVEVGSLRLRNAVALAPLAGLSDVPFRTLAWRMGAGYMVSEMLSSKPELWETGKSRNRRAPVPGVHPAVVQIAGSDPKAMAEAARRHVDEGTQAIDINFGCPAKKVCRKAAGSALLGDLDLVGRIVHEVAAAVDVPVTVKTRTGLRPGDGLGVAAGCVAAENGARMIVMHGRSRQCKFTGAVDFAPVARLVESLVARTRIPVLVNGEIRGVEAARRALQITGADGVMIGRGALGQPWIFAELNGFAVPDRAARWRLIREHVSTMHEFYGERAAVGIVRKHVIAYLGHMQYAQYARQFVQLRRAVDQLRWLRELSAADLGQSEFESSKITAALLAA